MNDGELIALMYDRLPADSAFVDTLADRLNVVRRDPTNQRVRNLLDEGWSTRQIAQELNVSQSRVARIAKVYDRYCEGAACNLE